MMQKMNLKLKILMFILTLAIMLAPLVSATKVTPISYPLPEYSTNALGGSQFYTVTFDAEGEAIVIAKLTFQNTGSVPLGSISLEIPGQVEIINAVQEVKAVKDKNNYYGWKYKTLPHSQNTLSTSSTFTFILPQAIDEQEQATILLYYKVRGMVQQGIFDYRFNFETIKHGQYTQQVRVSLAVQEGLYLKGGEIKLNYNNVMSTSFAQNAFASAESSSQEMSKLSQSLTYASGNIVKSASGLDPWESFSVDGIYSSSKLWLYRGNILGGLVIFAGLMLLCAWGIRRIKSKLKKELPFSGVLWGLGNSLIALAVGWFGFYLLEHLPRMFSYQLRDTVGIVIAFALVLLGFLLLLGFPIYLALQRNDWRIGLMVFAATIFGLVVGGMILVVVMQWG